MLGSQDGSYNLDTVLALPFVQKIIADNGNIMELAHPVIRPDKSDNSTNEEIWLLGQPLLRDYLRFVEESVLDGDKASRALLTDEWRAANDYYEELAKTEAGIADTVECRDLDPALRHLAEAVSADARCRKTFDSLPTRFGMVELDKLVVYQIHVTGTFVNALKNRLGSNPDPSSLFRFCLPLETQDAPVHIQKVGSKRYVFRSQSTDFRFQEAILLRPEQIGDYESYGPIAGVVGLAVGFGSNFLNVIHDDDNQRLLLHNGYHRACALRALGITHAPCIIQTVTRRDELDISAHSDVAKSPGYYFNAPRPPLLKDFFDPKIRKVLPTKKMIRMVEVNFDVKEFWLTE